jgi:DUF3040 family protein
MLSDAERRRLTEIELGLRLKDPHFVERFGHGGQRERDVYRRGSIPVAGHFTWKAVARAYAQLTPRDFALTMRGIDELVVAASRSGRCANIPAAVRGPRRRPGAAVLTERRKGKGSRFGRRRLLLCPQAPGTLELRAVPRVRRR